MNNRRTRSWSMILNASLYSWICDWSNMAKMFDVARCWRFLGGLALARDAMIRRNNNNDNYGFLYELYLEENKKQTHNILHSPTQTPPPSHCSNRCTFFLLSFSLSFFLPTRIDIGHLTDLPPSTSLSSFDTLFSSSFREMNYIYIEHISHMFRIVVVVVFLRKRIQTKTKNSSGANSWTNNEEKSCPILIQWIHGKEMLVSYVFICFSPKTKGRFGETAGLEEMMFFSFNFLLIHWFHYFVVKLEKETNKWGREILDYDHATSKWMGRGFIPGITNKKKRK